MPRWLSLVADRATPTVAPRGRPHSRHFARAPSPETKDRPFQAETRQKVLPACRCPSASWYSRVLPPRRPADHSNCRGLQNAYAVWLFPAFQCFQCIPWLNTPPRLSCPEGLSRPFVFARRASAAPNRPFQCAATRLSVFSVAKAHPTPTNSAISMYSVVVPLAVEFRCPSDGILMPVGKNSDGHQKTLRWASESTPMPIRRDRLPQRTKFRRR